MTSANADAQNLALLRLKKNEDRRLRAGHSWIYSNEVDSQATPLTGFVPGQQVVVVASNGKAMGLAYVNPHSLIAARLFNREGHPLDRSLIVHRLKIALSLRERLFPTPHYRLVHGEADGLPGLVVDRYGDVVVAQITT
ncbi:MAG: RlmI/RlmK family 23S rRNA methyltransferase, partial [Halothiobacillaceae bacterium]